MPSQERQSDIFKHNFTIWKCFGIWPGRIQSKYYKYCSFVYLFATLYIYNILLTLNLFYTPRKIELIIREMIFYFTEITITTKVLMVVLKRDEIIEAFDLLDSEDMNGDDYKSNRRFSQNYTSYQTYFKVYAILCNITYSFQVFLPIFLQFIFKSSVDLPICQYYFLSEEMRDNYFAVWYIYQSFGMYGHMMYNVSNDTFISGLLLKAIVHCQVLKEKLFDLKCTSDENLLHTEAQEQIQMAKLKKYLRRYDFLLNYCEKVQKVIDATIFIQFGLSCIIICVVMCGFLLPLSTEAFSFMVIYFCVMTLEIFIPGYLGTQLSYESQELVFAAYNTEWIPRSEPFKRSIRIFVERANIPIQMTGLKQFPLSLFTFTSIMKSAYSFFAVIRNFQDG